MELNIKIPPEEYPLGGILLVSSLNVGGYIFSNFSKLLLPFMLVMLSLLLSIQLLLFLYMHLLC